MKGLRLGSLTTVTATALLMSLGSAASADNTAPMTPEFAAKRETVRKQEEQRITPDKKRKAAEALKAERLKVYQAREAAKQLNPIPTSGGN